MARIVPAFVRRSGMGGDSIERLKVILMAVAVLGCSKSSVPEYALLSVTPDTKEVEFSVQDLVDNQFNQEFCIRNLGSAILKIAEVRLDVTTEVRLDETKQCPNGDSALFELQFSNGVQPPLEVSPQQQADQSSQLKEWCFSVVYEHDGRNCERRADVHILSNTRDTDQQDYVISLTMHKTYPHIQVSPEVVDFGVVPEGESRTSVFRILNVGRANLEVNSVEYTGSAGFSFKWSCKLPDDVSPYFAVKAGKTLKVGEKECVSPVVIEPNSAVEIEVRYGATSAEPAKAFLKLFSNDPEEADGVDVVLQANESGPCLLANPSELDFGSVLVGELKPQVVTLKSCGDQAVTIKDIRLAPDSSQTFSLDLSAFEGFPVKLPPLPEAQAQIGVLYSPQQVEQGADGKPQPDTGTIVVENDSPRPQLTIPLQGIAIEGNCPVADFKIYAGGKEVPDDGSVAVQTELEFKDLSYDPTPGGGIDAWDWSVSKPEESADIFQPSSTWPNPTFTANVVGDYLFRLDVVNKLGIKSCETAEKLVHVAAGEGCHIELTWETPNDPDPTDECGGGKSCGSDMDLHVVHPYASGPDIDKDGQPDGFFDTNWDCFWFHAHPTWNAEKASDVLYQPSLDRDDTNGAGPENFNYVYPDPDKCYKVGVHYWDDHGFGPSYPMIKMYVDGKLVYQKKGPKMVALDMWEVGEACCVEGTFKEYDFNGAPLVVPQYVNPDFKFGQ